MNDKKREEMEMDRRRRDAATVLWVVFGAIAFVALVYAFCIALFGNIHSGEAVHTAEIEVNGTLPADTPGKGIGIEVEQGTVLRVWCETDENLPEWWDPSSAEIVYQEPIAQPIHSDALDYNLNTTLWGWDGHGIEVLELDLFARVFYLEFWGASEPCCEAGCDAILNLWDTGLYGKTLGEALSAKNAQGKYVYSVYPDVWTTNYNAEGLEWCKQLCLERFVNGPEWEAIYFQKWEYHDTSWTIPLYEMDGVYFSMGR